MYNKKKVIIITMCVTILLMITGYAVFSSNLKINGTANIETTWEVLFTKIEKINVIGKASELSTPIASGTTASFQVGLTKPGDGIEYRITVSNRGDFDAVIEDIKASYGGDEAVKFEIKNIKKGDKLLKKSSTTFNIKVYFDESITDHPGKVENNLTIEMKYSQDIGQSVPSETPVIKSTRLATRILQDNVAVSDSGIDFSKVSSDTNGKGLYYTEKNTEGNKRTYYFRGAVTNNYVSFAGHIWRIVRINEDGSVRLIKKDNIGSSQYNSKSGDNSFVGYMHSTPTTYKDGSGTRGGTSTYLVRASVNSTVKVGSGYTFNNQTGEYTLTGVVDGSYTSNYYNYYTCTSTAITCVQMFKIVNAVTNNGYNELRTADYHAGYFSTTYENAHKNEENSTIKTAIDNWYKANLSSYSNYISDSGFCSDRSVDTGTGIGRVTGYYGTHKRLTTSKIPQFKCPNESRDLFTTTTSSKGNKALAYPIGMITADEVVYAGAVYGAGTSNFYLGTSPFWIGSPYGYVANGSFARVWVITNGFIGNDDARIYSNILPVINLKSNVEISNGEGTSSSPYVIAK